MDKKETNRLIKEAQAGDIEARNKVVMACLGLIGKAFKFRDHKLRIRHDDLWQEGVLGLIDAIMTFNEDKGLFSSWAFLYIRKYIYRYINKNKDIVRQPLCLKYYIEQLRQEELAGKKLTSAQRHIVSLENIYETSINTTPVGYIATVSQEHDPTLKDILDKAWDITTKDLNIFMSRMEGSTFKEIGERHNMTKQRAHQIYKKVEDIFKDRLKDKVM